jgi:hypothetical protein
VTLKSTIRIDLVKWTSCRTGADSGEQRSKLVHRHEPRNWGNGRNLADYFLGKRYGHSLSTNGNKDDGAKPIRARKPSNKSGPIHLKIHTTDGPRLISWLSPFDPVFLQ